MLKLVASTTCNMGILNLLILYVQSINVLYKYLFESNVHQSWIKNKEFTFFFPMYVYVYWNATTQNFFIRAEMDEQPSRLNLQRYLHSS